MDKHQGLARRIGTVLINRIGTVVLIVVIVLVGVSIAGYIGKWEWTGLRGIADNESKTFKTLWDWLGLLIVPAFLAAGALWFRRVEEESRRAREMSKRAVDQERLEAEGNLARNIEEQRAQEATLETYFDRMSELLLDKDDPLLKSEPNSPAREMAATRTLAVLRRLEENRRNQVFQFLSDAHLLGRPEKKPPPSWLAAKPQILKPLARKADPFSVLEDRSIEDMDLSRANLGEANLSGARMSGTKLVEANLMFADLTGVQLRKANLAGAYLNEANLKASNLWGADLEGATLVSANLEGAVMEEANFEGAYLTSACLKGAFLAGARLKGVILYGANLEGASLVGANLEGADLEQVNLEGAVGLTCTQIRAARNWKKAFRDETLACGAEIPEPPGDGSEQGNIKS